MRRTWITTGRALFGAALIATLLLAGCSSDGDDPSDTTTSAAAADGSTTTTAADGATSTTAADGAAPTATTLGGEAAAPLGDLAGQLNDADLGCDTVEGQRTADGAQGAAQCDLAEAPAYLYTFTDNDQRDAFIDNGGVIDCTFIFGSGVSFDYVVADGVIVRPEDNADADALADALDGEVRTIACELPDDAG